MRLSEMVQIGIMGAAGVGASGLAVAAMFAWQFRKDLFKYEKDKVAKKLHLGQDGAREEEHRPRIDREPPPIG